MKNKLTSEELTRLEEFIKKMLPWAHGHQIKSITAFVAAIIEKQTGNQAELARPQGNQESASKRLSRLIHNERLSPKDFAEWLARQALEQLPRVGKIRVTIDWTSEGDQHLLVISVVVGHRALPICWRAYSQSALKGQLKRDEHAVIKRAFKLIFSRVDRRRIKLTADRGFADDDLFDLLDELKSKYTIRVKGSVNVLYKDQWVKLSELSFSGNQRHRDLGWVYDNQSSPYRVWLTISRARDQNGKWGIWRLVSNEPVRARGAAKEYGYRFCCEEGFRDAKWYLGFAKARSKNINAWSRLFALFAIALLAMTTLGMKLLIGGGAKARELLRRVASRRRDRCELSLISAVGALLRQDWSLISALSPYTKLNLEATLSNVS
jgi:hypothetical protein